MEPLLNRKAEWPLRMKDIAFRLEAASHLNSKASRLK